MKLWDLSVSRKEHDEKCLLAKNQHLIAIWGRDISSVMPR